MQSGLLIKEKLQWRTSIFFRC